MQPAVSIVEHGRSGEVLYRDSRGALRGYWEFGGGDVVVTVSMGTAEAWLRAQPWAVGERTAILRFVAKEVVRQRAPTCTAEVDELSGDIILQQAGAAATGHRAPGGRRSTGNPVPPPAEAAATWVRRYADLRARFALVVLALVLVAGGIAWLQQDVFAIDPGKGSPLGDSVRTATHVATLIDTLQPYMPTLNRDPSRDRRRLSLLLVPLDGGEPALVPVTGDLQPGSYSLSRVIGSDGRTVWLVANDLYGVEPGSLTLVTPEEVKRANPSLDPQWIDDTRGMELFDGRLRMRALDGSGIAFALDPATRRAVPVDAAPSGAWPLRPRPEDYLDGDTLRSGPRAGPLKLHDPDGTLRLSPVRRDASGTLQVSRVDAAGRAAWTTDTGIDRFRLQQVLPGPDSTAFVGPWPQVPNDLGEPLLVILRHADGSAVSHSLLR